MFVGHGAGTKKPLKPTFVAGEDVDPRSAEVHSVQQCLFCSGVEKGQEVYLILSQAKTDRHKRSRSASGRGIAIRVLPIKVELVHSQAHPGGVGFGFWYPLNEGYAHSSFSSALVHLRVVSAMRY